MVLACECPECHVVGAVTCPLTMRATRHVFLITATCVYPCRGRTVLAGPHLHRPLRKWPPEGGRPQLFTLRRGAGAQAEGDCRGSVLRFHCYCTAFQARSRTASGTLDTLRHEARLPHASLLKPGFAPWEWGSTRSIRGTSLGSCCTPRLFTSTVGRREMTVCVTARGTVEGGRRSGGA
jgi:hypothetical protein